MCVEDLIFSALENDLIKLSTEGRHPLFLTRGHGIISSNGIAVLLSPRVLRSSLAEFLFILRLVVGSCGHLSQSPARTSSMDYNFIVGFHSVDYYPEFFTSSQIL